MQYNLNDKVKLKKQHPCGSFEWLVIRVGADYKLQCCICGKVIMLSSLELNKRIKK